MDVDLVRLHVNVDHVATVRNARGTEYPDPVAAARLCIDAGAHGITAHLREDRRHIRDEDVERLRAAIASTFNLEMAATREMSKIARAIGPDVVTLVPERREERTTEGGLDVAGAGPELGRVVKELSQAEIKVSLFIAPEARQIEAAAKLGVEQIEIHTGEYAHAFGQGVTSERIRLDSSAAIGAGEIELSRIEKAAKLAREAGLEVAAGHGLTLRNVPFLMRAREIGELNIGHAMIADSIFMGLAGSVRAMKDAVAKGIATRQAEL